ncbi:MAG: HAMP domain-containing histidine kinase [Deltaproteobacteria bacterium]|nr:HAMP domain-containing histidine kinase [Deltaproteobacteria bacterium]
MNKISDNELLDAVRAKIGAADKSNQELMDAIKARFDEKNKAHHDLERAFRNLEETNKKLIESEKTRSNFLSELRNEINNPMAAIIALTESMLHNDAADLEMYKNMARILFKEAVILDFHMNNILMAAELEAGEVELNVSRVDVNAVISEKLERFAFMVKDKKIKVEREEDKPLFTNLDSELLGVAVMNLISNALVFNSEGGTLAVSAVVEGEKLVVAVTDSGIGINEKDQKKIFDRFQQLDVGLTKKYRGLGLGLSVTKAAVDMLGGDIIVKSSPGKGSTFALSIPAMLSESVDNVSVDGTEFFF